MRRLEGHTGNVRAVAFTPDGRLVSAGDDRTVRVWDLSTGESVPAVRAGGPVYAVAVSPDGRTLAYAGRHPRPADRGTPVHLWDLVAGRAAGEYRLPPAAFPRSVWSLAFSHDGKILAAAGRRLSGGNITAGAGGHWWGPDGDGPLADETAFELAFAPDRALLAVAGNGRLGFYPATDPTADVSLPVARPEAVAFIPGTGDAVVAAGGSLYVVGAVPSGKPRRVKTGSRVVMCVAAFPGGRSVVTGGKPGAVEVFDPQSGALRASYDFDLGGVHAVTTAPDGLTFAAAGERGLAVCDADPNW